MAKNCKNCKWFCSVGNGYSLDNKNYGRCNNEKFLYGGMIKNPKEKDLLIYSDFEGYAAGFDVGIEFGCIHWERK